jgi:hypothetical protein
MGYFNGRVTEIRLDASKQMEAFIDCPVEALPRGGQYLLASDPYNPGEVLGTAIFVAEMTVDGFWAAPPIPLAWKPGTSLDLVGPLGRGFNLPREVQRLGLIALGDTISRLMPLVSRDQQPHRGMTLFTDLPLPRIPAFLEVYPLSSLVEALDWPDFMVVDLPLHRLPELRDVLGIPQGIDWSCPTQVLLTTPMPCAGLAKCGACAVPARRGWKLVCEDGPVFDLNQLKW